MFSECVDNTQSYSQLALLVSNNNVHSTTYCHSQYCSNMVNTYSQLALLVSNTIENSPPMEPESLPPPHSNYRLQLSDIVNTTHSPCVGGAVTSEVSLGASVSKDLHNVQLETGNDIIRLIRTVVLNLSHATLSTMCLLSFAVLCHHPMLV